MLHQLLMHPLTRGLDINDPQTTMLRMQIIRQNQFLCRLYREWYLAIAREFIGTNKPVLELGSGAGFMRDFIPNLITSDILQCQNVHVIMDGIGLPFANCALEGIVMLNVFHHIAKPRDFLYEAARCVISGGRLVMIEPWVSPWSSIIYTHLHTEPYFPDAKNWEFPEGGPLSNANGALPWIVFFRDREMFVKEFPMWRILTISPSTPFRYLVSGGVSMRPLMPGWAFGLWKQLEAALNPWMNRWAMFARIVLLHQES